MADSASPLKKKKLPFKPTALRRTSVPKPSASPDGASADYDDPLQLFRRGKEMEPIVAADRERRLRRKKKKEEERRRSSGEKRPLENESDHDDAPRQTGAQGLEPTEPSSHEDQSFPATDEATEVGGYTFRDSNLVTPPPSKRSRLDTSSSKKPVTSIEEADYVLDESPSTQLLRSHTKPTTPRRANVIALDSDSDSDADVKFLATPSKPRASSVEVAKSPSPEGEYADYIKAAEQRAKASASAVKDKVDIIVTSMVPGSKGCCVKFTFDKPLKLVRDSWVALQSKNRIPLGMAADDEVILTWRRKRIYTVDTLVSIGIQPQGNGRVVTADRSRGGLSDNATRVHMEAWTPSLFQEMENEEQIQRRRDAGELSDDDNERPAAESPPPPEVKIRVILKARDLDPVKLTVRPETTTETLITGFRTQRSIGLDREVVLRFDGEAMAEHMTMEDAEIDDMDSIEVHVK